MFNSPTKYITLFQTLLLVIIIYPEFYTGITLILFLLCLTRLILKIGNGSFFLELLHAYAAFSCLLMPLVGYKFYDDVTTMILWVRKMPIPPEEYFAFNIPAVISMGLGFFFYRDKSPDDRPVIRNIFTRLKVDLLSIRPPVILILTVSSLVAYFITNFLPQSIQQVNTFLYYSLYASGFYILFYKKFPWKWYFITGLVGFV